MSLKTGLVRIGNSRGVRLPKPLIEHHGFGEVVELDSRADGILIRRPQANPREGWDEDAKAMAAAGEDESVWPEPFDNEFDRAEWTWPSKRRRATTSTSLRSTPRRARRSRKRGPA